FDLDDTLVNSTGRTVLILRQFASQPDVRTRYPQKSAKLLQVTETQIHYNMADTFAALGVTDSDLLKQAQSFWISRFLSSPYAAKDDEEPGAALYLQALVGAGAHLVYVTGRIQAQMHDGTVEDMERLEFPLGTQGDL